MIKGIAEKAVRAVNCRTIEADLTIIGGGLAGVCAAITAAREGIKVTLVQDRPVLGGNASSEVRLWALGATSHMGNNNRWAREGGVIDELMVENTFRNKEGNPVIFDTVLMEKVLEEKNITLLLNTAAYEVEKEGGDRIACVTAYNPQNETRYILRSPLFCDASGDGIVAYRAGAAYRFGAEEKEEFDECFSPSDNYGKLLGHSMFFYTKKCDKPVKFVAPSYALKDITMIPKYDQIGPAHSGCYYWWFEYGGMLNTITDTEEIKHELWKVIYGAWDYIKNSGRFPEAENLTLEWVATIPGKRESRRFEGLYMLSQKDIVEQRRFDDAVSFGGWAVDLHPAAGVYSPLPSCNQYHAKGVYQIPYRCFVSSDIENLFMAGRIISVSHVAFGSTRVMTTCGHGGQAVGMAAAICSEKGCMPAGVTRPDRMKELQQRLSLAGQGIPFVSLAAENNLLSSARITVSSALSLGEIPFGGEWLPLEFPTGQMLPLKKGTAYSFEIPVKAERETTLTAQLFVSSKAQNHTPDVELETLEIKVAKGEQTVGLAFTAAAPADQYGFVILRSNPGVMVGLSEKRYTGVLSVINKFNLRVNNLGRQIPPEGSGFESFEFWCPERRPEGKNLSMRISPAINAFGGDNLTNGYMRPAMTSNAWVADLADERPVLTLEWDSPQKVAGLTFYLDTDYDHPMETVQYNHPEDVMPFCVRNITVKDSGGNVVAGIVDNHQTIVTVIFDRPLSTQRLTVEVERPSDNVPAAIFEIIAKQEK